MSDNHHAVLDVLGEESPIPVIRTKESLDELKTGEVLKVTTDKQSAVDNIQTLVSNNPFTLLSQNKEDGKICFAHSKAVTKRITLFEQN